MGTRSRIAIETPQGVTSIYCHWDGYPSNNGKILIDHYTAVSKINRLMKLGDISVLGAEIGKKIAFETPTAERCNQCIAYRRDRGDKDVTTVFHADVDTMYAYSSDGWAEFVYLYRDGKWLVSATGDKPAWRPVSDVLAEQLAEAE